MKSNEEFIAGIYAKANERKAKNINGESDNVIPISSYPSKSKSPYRVKKFSTYAAGLAACFVCGIGVYLISNVGNVNEGDQRIQDMRMKDQSQVSPMMVGSDAPIINYESLLQCTVVDWKQNQNMYSVTVTLADKSKATLIIPEELMDDRIEENLEIVVEVDEPDNNNNFRVVPDSEIFVFLGIENGEKIFVSKTNAVVRESELSTVIE